MAQDDGAAIDQQATHDVRRDIDLDVYLQP